MEGFIARTPMRSLTVRFCLNFVEEVRTGNLRQSLSPKAPFHLHQLERLLPTSRSSVRMPFLTGFSVQPRADDRFVINEQNGQLDTGSSVDNPRCSYRPPGGKDLTLL